MTQGRNCSVTFDPRGKRDRQGVELSILLTLQCTLDMFVINVFSSITMKNPALRQEPRFEPAAVIPLKQEDSMLTWLESEGRLIPRETKNTALTEEEDPEMDTLMSIDDRDDDDDFSKDEPDNLDD
ncbi:DUF3134 domain-containing protein [Spirulina sp. 06S082]|uniref:DUF3134 domain-containing protein n=1 Tax=Spirulina sp. 06S082 TaxID=3110248 RepID=UPI002B218079|nr:DUF3134 domain-containing protein [Spirulina sp. 06S082]MEA5470315.1 DUF3134 domain-containing protein [Spirulina sp. 06S082]